MGKAERNRRQSAREKIAAQQAAARRAEVRRQMMIVGGSIVVVLAIVVAFVAIKLSASPAKAGPTAGGKTAAAVQHDLATVPTATLDSVGKGATYPDAVQTIKTASTPLASGGKPEIVYVGAEYCPFCAAERWAIVTALSRFGTFSGLGLIHSSATDTDANTPTLTFLNAVYKSTYVVFSTTEAETVLEKPLQKMTPLDTQLMAKYDIPPYVQTTSEDGSYPFVDFGNKYVIDGASYDPTVLAGKSWTQIATALRDPSSPIATGADGAANLITAAICKLTGNQPASACTPTVKALEGSI
jgi:thiol-disulfide isomerase/thioredoxin